MFEVIESPLKPLWVPVDYTAAVVARIGQMVYGGMATTPVPSLSGVALIPAATGAANTTAKHIPFGVICGLATRSGRTFDTTYMSEYDTSVNTQAALVARDVIGVEGMISKTDPIVAVQIMRIMGTHTVIKGSIFLTTFGVPPTEVTATTGSADGLTWVGATNGITTPVALNGTTFCRVGANAGIYRVTSSSGAGGNTTRVVLIPFPYDIAIGNKFVDVPIKVGTCFMQTDALALFINGAVCDATNCWIINCWEMDLKVAGKETAIFSFTGDHFCAHRA
jgi:hypothetical protein